MIVGEWKLVFKNYNQADCHDVSRVVVLHRLGTYTLGIDKLEGIIQRRPLKIMVEYKNELP